MNDAFSYQGLKAHTIVAENNISYLSSIHNTPILDPPGGATVGLMMLLSSFQYQAPYMGPIYSEAAANAGKAAFNLSGGQAFQDKFLSHMNNIGKDMVHSIGVTDTELGIVLGTLKTIRDRQLSVNGPPFHLIKTNLTAALGSGSIGVKYEW